MINERRYNKFQTDIRKMNSFLLEIKKEIDANKITQKNKVTLKIFGELDDLQNYEHKMKANMYKLQEMYKYNTIMYDNCLTNIQNIDLGKNSNIIDNFGGNESSLNLRKSQLQKKNNNSNSRMSVKGYETLGVFGDIKQKHNVTRSNNIASVGGNFYYKFDTIDMGQKHTYVCDKTQAKCEILILRHAKIFSFDLTIHAFSIAIRASVNNYALIVNVKIDVQGLYDRCAVYDDCG